MSDFFATLIALAIAAAVLRLLVVGIENKLKRRFQPVLDAARKAVTQARRSDIHDLNLALLAYDAKAGGDNAKPNDRITS